MQWHKKHQKIRGGERPKSELDELLGSEAEKLAKEKREAPERLSKIEKTEKMLENYIGWGIADEMPLDQIIGFLAKTEEDTGKAAQYVGEPSYSKDELRKTQEFLASCIPEEITTDPNVMSNKTPLGKVFEYLKREREKIEEIVGIEI